MGWTVYSIINKNVLKSEPSKEPENKEVQGFKVGLGLIQRLNHDDVIID